MVSYSVPVPEGYEANQQNLDGLQDLVETFKNFRETEGGTRADIFDKYVTKISKDFSNLRSDGYIVRFLCQAVRIRSAMERFQELKTCAQKMDDLVDKLLKQLPGQRG